MIRRFFIWRAHKKLARTRYRLDRREYRGQFRAGFMSHLHHARFWESDSDPSFYRRRFRKRLRWIILLLLIGFLGWVLYESVVAISSSPFRT
jgi:hypothetical protein